ncbi:Iron-sulfur cluster carrier protein [bioreactor metagenome]|uniref:Iron-sulfur cluster carrier protein n=1 Tax=bioreactor metagenome TaxID=1076179 RepID=A0A644ZSE9_9ZZZZ|nr:Mrp/NBP35 family ATP-binding protein [Christensenella sp.]
MEECTHDCSSYSANCGSREKKSLLETPHAMTHVKKVIGVVSGKGGVGKSIVTSMLAVLMRRRGYRTAILDADITGPSIPQAFGLHERAEGSDQGIYPVLSKTGVEVMSMNLLLENETDPVVWRGPMIAGSVKQFWTDVLWGDVDVMFLDMPPGTGDVPLTVFQSIPVDGIVVVTSPQQLVSMIVEKAVHMAGLMKIPVLALVQNMSFIQCPGCDEVIHPFGENDIKALAEKHGIPLTAELPIQKELASACDAGLIELFEGSWLNGLADMIEGVIKA